MSNPNDDQYSPGESRKQTEAEKSRQKDKNQDTVSRTVGAAEEKKQAELEKSSKDNEKEEPSLHTQSNLSLDLESPAARLQHDKPLDTDKKKAEATKDKETCTDALKIIKNKLPKQDNGQKAEKIMDTVTGKMEKDNIPTSKEAMKKEDGKKEWTTQVKDEKTGAVVIKTVVVETSKDSSVEGKETPPEGKQVWTFEERDEKTGEIVTKTVMRETKKVSPEKKRPVQTKESARKVTNEESKGEKLVSIQTTVTKRIFRRIGVWEVQLLPKNSSNSVWKNYDLNGDKPIGYDFKIHSQEFSGLINSAHMNDENYKEFLPKDMRKSPLSSTSSSPYSTRHMPARSELSENSDISRRTSISLTSSRMAAQSQQNNLLRRSSSLSITAIMSREGMDTTYTSELKSQSKELHRIQKESIKTSDLQAFATQKHSEDKEFSNYDRKIDDARKANSFKPRPVTNWNENCDVTEIDEVKQLVEKIQERH